MSTNLCDYNSLVYAAKISCSYCIVYKMLKPLKNDVSSFISSPVVCLCDTPGVVRRPSSVVCVVSSNLTTADMKEII